VLRNYRDRLASVDDETKTLLETLRAEGERERAKILREAEELASKIKADADFVSQQEIKIARQQVREEIAQIARETAESAIRANLRAADQERLVEQFLHGIEGVR
jgi:F-type H+-transporting ATPase subunit b